MHPVKAIFISHEHSDHIRGVEVLSKKYKLPVYITTATLNNSKLKIPVELIRDFKHNSSTGVEGLIIKAFSKRHDAADPYSFVVSGNGVHIGVFTDIGSCCENVIEHFKYCDAVFLEANYDTEMLETGMYPYYLKKRITNGHGHLSNHQSLELFTTHRSAGISHLILSHLSKENNSPELVKQLFEKHAGNTRIIVASRYYETEVYEVAAAEQGHSPLAEARANVYLKSSQLSMF